MPSSHGFTPAVNPAPAVPAIPEVGSWDDVSCAEEGKEVLRKAGLRPSVGAALVAVTGYHTAEDLAYITEDYLRKIPLKPIEEIKLRKVIATAKADAGIEDALSSTMGGGAAAAGAALQTLADQLAGASTGEVVDLGGKTYAGPVNGSVIKLAASNVTLCNGKICLTPDQSVWVTGRQVKLRQVRVEGVADGIVAAGAAVQTTKSVVRVRGGELVMEDAAVVSAVPEVALLVTDGGSVDMTGGRVSAPSGAVCVLQGGSKLTARGGAR